ncbi:hypothetical protein AWB78_08402 [Caballeronia calidae]|uniref:Uncharacterized protein n=1 Tax=Caballeronia calidae TaxID=1777139 RepID=A0A158EJL2_9BURK|nr:hypothetical protein AWB78_08402 [Caballeronia calidae]
MMKINHSSSCPRTCLSSHAPTSSTSSQKHRKSSLNSTPLGPLRISREPWGAKAKRQAFVNSVARLSESAGRVAQLQKQRTQTALQAQVAQQRAELSEVLRSGDASRISGLDKRFGKLSKVRKDHIISKLLKGSGEEAFILKGNAAAIRAYGNFISNHVNLEKIDNDAAPVRLLGTNLFEKNWRADEFAAYMDVVGVVCDKTPTIARSRLLESVLRGRRAAASDGPLSWKFAGCNGDVEMLERYASFFKRFGQHLDPQSATLLLKESNMMLTSWKGSMGASAEAVSAYGKAISSYHQACGMPVAAASLENRAWLEPLLKKTCRHLLSSLKRWQAQEIRQHSKLLVQQAKKGQAVWGQRIDDALLPNSDILRDAFRQASTIKDYKVLGAYIALLDQMAPYLPLDAKKGLLTKLREAQGTVFCGLVLKNSQAYEQFKINDAALFGQFKKLKETLKSQYVPTTEAE